MSLIKGTLTNTKVISTNTNEASTPVEMISTNTNGPATVVKITSTNTKETSMNTKGAPTNLARAVMHTIAPETRDAVPPIVALHDRGLASSARPTHRSLQAAIGGTTALHLGIVGIVLSFLGPARPVLAQPTCVLMYDFEENTAPGGTLADTSGFGAPLAMTKFGGAGGSSPTYSADTPVSGDGHPFGGAALRIGAAWSMGYVPFAGNRKHELQHLTVEAWVRPPTANFVGGTVVCHLPTGAGCIGRGWILGAGPSGASFSVGLGASPGAFVNVSGLTTLTPGVWHHVAGSYDGTTLRVFVDGVQRNERFFPGVIEYTTGPLPSGCGGAAGPNPTTTYLAAYHNNNSSGPTFTADLQFGLAEGTLLDRVRVLNLAVAGIAGNGSPAFDLDYYACHSGCVADTDDGSGTGTCDGGVTIDDLLYYLRIFEEGLLSADVDDGSGGGTPDGGVTIDDLLYYLVRFENGC